MTVTYHKNIIVLICLSMLVGSCISHAINKSKNLKCEIIEKVINHPEVTKTLLLTENTKYKEKVRIFTLEEEILCSGITNTGWQFNTFSNARPSINTGYNRDLFVYFDHKSKLIKVYLASHQHDNNRQTTYLLEFKNNESFEIVGFSEYTDSNF